MFKFVIRVSNKGKDNEYVLGYYEQGFSVIPVIKTFFEDALTFITFQSNKDNNVECWFWYEEYIETKFENVLCISQLIKNDLNMIREFYLEKITKYFNQKILPKIKTEVKN